MSRSHYKVDQSYVKTRTRRDSEQEAEEAREYGYFSWKELEIVPLKDIVPEKVWKPSRLERIQQGIAQKKALPPVSLAKSERGSYRYEISDGIHRYNASLLAGYTHIPALVTKYKDVPHLKEELPTFEEGTYVKFRKKLDGRWEIGFLVENIFGTVFTVVAGDMKGAEWIGDFSSDYFEKEVDPPKAIKDHIQGHWFMSKTSSEILSKISKSDTPKTVKKYVDKFLDKGYDESYAYAMAWSIFCKYKYPNSDRCQQDSYLSKKSFALVDSEVVSELRDFDTQLRNEKGLYQVLASRVPDFARDLLFRFWTSSTESGESVSHVLAWLASQSLYDVSLEGRPFFLYLKENSPNLYRIALYEMSKLQGTLQSRIANAIEDALRKGFEDHMGLPKDSTKCYQLTEEDFTHFQNITPLDKPLSENPVYYENLFDLACKSGDRERIREAIFSCCIANALHYLQTGEHHPMFEARLEDLWTQCRLDKDVLYPEQLSLQARTFWDR